MSRDDRLQSQMQTRTLASNGLSRGSASNSPARRFQGAAIPRRGDSKARRARIEQVDAKRQVLVSGLFVIAELDAAIPGTCPLLPGYLPNGANS
jgi:hypothetical protein